MKLRTLGLLTLGLAIMLLIVTLQPEREMAKPPKSDQPEEAGGGQSQGVEVTPQSGGAPEQGESTEEEQGIGMPGTPEDLRRLKEAADAPDIDESTPSQNDE